MLVVLVSVPESIWDTATVSHSCQVRREVERVFPCPAGTAVPAGRLSGKSDRRKRINGDDFQNPISGEKLILLAAMLVNLFLFVLPAADASESVSEYDDIDWPARGSDPSEIISRLEFRNEYIGEPEGNYRNASIFRGDYAPSESWLVRTEIPLVAADNHEFGSHFGLGDITFGARGKIRLPERFSIITGVDFILNTAEEELLGTGRNQIVPFIIGVWKPHDLWILGLQYLYFKSFSGDELREEISEMLIRPQALYHLPEGFWLLLDPKIYIDQEHYDSALLFLEGEFGKVLNEHYEIWLRGGGHVTGEGREELLGWKAEAGIRFLWH